MGSRSPAYKNSCPTKILRAASRILPVLFLALLEAATRIVTAPFGWLALYFNRQ